MSMSTLRNPYAKVQKFVPFPMEKPSNHRSMQAGPPKVQPVAPGKRYSPNVSLDGVKEIERASHTTIVEHRIHKSLLGAPKYRRNKSENKQSKNVWDDEPVNYQDDTYCTPAPVRKSVETEMQYYSQYYDDVASATQLEVEADKIASMTYCTPKTNNCSYLKPISGTSVAPVELLDDEEEQLPPKVIKKNLFKKKKLVKHVLGYGVYRGHARVDTENLYPDVASFPTDMDVYMVNDDSMKAHVVLPVSLVMSMAKKVKDNDD